MWIILVSLVVVTLCIALFILGWLRSSHQIRYVDRYDMELESDYKAIVEQTGKRGN